MVTTMKKRSLKEWSSLAEVVASVGVVMSLIFVGYSINQNTNTLRAANDNLLFELQDLMMAQVSGDPVLASILLKKEEGEEVSAIEAKQWMWYLYRYTSLWELAYNRHENGLMAEDEWLAWDRSFRIWLLDPKIGQPEEIWKANDGLYGAGFTAYVDAAYSSRRQD